ncbi:MAG: bifunctional folylpolyglutamate synthase/dihydrofolate synthase [Clostridia bacterium]|nr:bifunctional folylpolyglutamate synthase/dihydrofolate synthase [Clostridia bacterium]
MNAAQIIDTIHAARYTGEKRGLDNTRALMDQLHIPYTPAPAIHVAGTNGKGSTCAMLESALRHAGYKTGLYTSPFLQVYNERIRINGRMISDEMLEIYGNPVLEAAEKLAREKDIHPTAFELGTALAYSVFYHEKVDCAVIEVGLGGRLDPSNVVIPEVSVIAALALDHTAILGDTLPQIAAEKAGIIKPGVPVVALKPNDDEVAQVLEARAKALGAPLVWADPQWITAVNDAKGAEVSIDAPRLKINARINLPGFHQQKNGLLAAMALQEFGLNEAQIAAGLGEAQWPARLEWADYLLLDGAHNAQGARALKKYVDAFLRGQKKVLLMGVLEEKLDEEMLNTMASLAEEAVTVTPDSPRALPAQELADRLMLRGCRARTADSLAEGLEKARTLAGEGVVICAGSLYLAGAMRTLLGLEPR